MRRRTLVRIIAIVIAVAACAVVILLVRPAVSPSENALVGQTEAAVRDRYGPPKDEFEGHYGAPPLNWTQQFKGEVKSCVFGGFGGQVYVTFKKRNGQWVVIANSYLPDGSLF